MVWECMNAIEVKNLTFINKIMNQNVYLNIFNENLSSNAMKLNL